MIKERLHLFADAYTNLDAGPLIDALAKDCVFESQMVLKPMKGKTIISNYLRAKFQTIKAGNLPVICSLRRVTSGPVLDAIGEPCVVLCQGDQRAVALIKLNNDGLINRIDLCIVPSPDDTSPYDDGNE